MDSSLQQVTKNILKEMPNIPYTECPLDFRWELDLILKINGVTFVAVPYVARNRPVRCCPTPVKQKRLMPWWWHDQAESTGACWESSRVVVSNMFVDWGVLPCTHLCEFIEIWNHVLCDFSHSFTLVSLHAWIAMNNKESFNFCKLRGFLALGRSHFKPEVLKVSTLGGQYHQKKPTPLCVAWFVPCLKVGSKNSR